MPRKKGSTRDLIALFRIGGPLIIILFIGGALYFEVGDALGRVDVLKPYMNYYNNVGSAITVLDVAPIFIILSLIATSLFLASRVGANPIFLPFSLIFGIFAIYMSAQVSNILVEMAEAPIIIQYTGRFPLSEQMLLHLEKIVTVMWIILLSIMYKSDSGSRGQRQQVRTP